MYYYIIYYIINNTLGTLDIFYYYFQRQLKVVYTLIQQQSAYRGEFRSNILNWCDAWLIKDIYNQINILTHYIIQYIH